MIKRERFASLVEKFKETFGDYRDIKFFSAPGRTEIGGNHTDHQHGCVLAASINLDIKAAAAPNGTDEISCLLYTSDAADEL